MQSHKETIDISAVEDHDGILTIRGGGARRDWNGIHYKQGMSGKNVGTTSLSANIATIPPGGVAYAHIHVGFEVILYIIEGKVRHEFGAGLKQVIENEAGDFIYIKPGVPHEVFNMSDTEPVVAFVARSSADEWDNIIPYDRISGNVARASRLAQCDFRKRGRSRYFGRSMLSVRRLLLALLNAEASCDQHQRQPGQQQPPNGSESVCAPAKAQNRL